jgi:hypothetical protein
MLPVDGLRSQEDSCLTFTRRGLGDSQVLVSGGVDGTFVVLFILSLRTGIGKVDSDTKS